VRHWRWRTLLVTACVALALAVVACGDSGSSNDSATTRTGSGADQATEAAATGKKPVIWMVIYDATGGIFWKKVVAGADEAARSLGVEVKYQYAHNDPTQENNLISTAAAQGVAGIGVSMNVPQSYVKSVKAAMAKGIPVVSFNIDDPATGRLAFVGQTFPPAGYAIGKYLVGAMQLKQGDKLVCPVEHPDATYAKERLAGVQRALDAVGAKCSLLDTGAIGLDDTQTKLTQYLVGHRDTKGIISLGLLPMDVGPEAAKQAGMANLPIGGFEIDKKIAENISKGRILATVDQQPFYQGFMTVAQLAYAAKYKLAPMDMNTGLAIIDKRNIGAVLPLTNTVR
jgi:simple sugar transport system substrate-binding protein